MKTDCEIIRDLMPLCAEQIASEKSRALVDEHVAECADCRERYAAMQQPEPAITEHKTEAEHFERSYKKERKHLIRKVGWIVGLIAAIVGAVLAMLTLLIVVTVGSLTIVWNSAKPEVHEDIADYNRFIGAHAEKDYSSKWCMDESIFPAAITPEMQVEDYKMVYYNPWDAQYLSYLTVSYPEEAYTAEAERLEAYPSTPYEGYYTVTAFPEGELLAMNADPYSGFVYAIRTPGKERSITYVELIFCNYCYDLDYMQYIPAEYLPPGFDATIDNPYGEQMLAAGR